MQGETPGSILGGVSSPVHPIVLSGSNTWLMTCLCAPYLVLFDQRLLPRHLACIWLGEVDKCLHAWSLDFFFFFTVDNPIKKNPCATRSAQVTTLSRRMRTVAWRNVLSFGTPKKMLSTEASRRILQIQTVTFQGVPQKHKRDIFICTTEVRCKAVVLCSLVRLRCLCLSSAWDHVGSTVRSRLCCRRKSGCLPSWRPSVKEKNIA